MQLIRPRFVSSFVPDISDAAFRAALGPPGSYIPYLTPNTVGVYSDVTRTTQGATTWSTAGVSTSNKDFTGIQTCNADGLVFTNCYFHGGATPSTYGLVRSDSTIMKAGAHVTFIDCTFAPDTLDVDWNGWSGVNAKFVRCDIHDCQDGMQARPADNGFTGVELDRCAIYNMIRYTAAAPGPVHPTDVYTHNDCFQQFGGRGTTIKGSYFDAQHRRQAGHWWCVGDPHVEPYVTIALNSLPDGGPYQLLPDRGSGTEATGRYNGGTANLACIMINDSAGSSYEWVVEDNFFNGGNYAINGGGNQPPAGGGVSLGSWKRNKFYRNQGSQGSGGDTTNTINLQGGTWTTGTSDIPLTGANANTYIDDGAYIQVRY